MYPVKPVPACSELQPGKEIPNGSMFSIRELLRGSEHVGYLFSSPFYTQNRGGILITSLADRIANGHEVCVKLDHLVIYNYPNTGSIAASPKVGPTVARMLESQ